MNNISDSARKWALIILVHVIVVVAWHYFVVLGEVPLYVMPTPGQTIMSIFGEYNWLHNTMITTGEVFGGYALAVVVGVTLAVLFSWNATVSEFLMPLVVSLN
ncbi:MAG: ABC transporter permease, partial [Alphaproteobacteria bacterium]|nr:ABC transporter permease [Alphaproteobacteria bacterium]